MNVKRKKVYETPQVTEFVCKIEKGFAGSGTNGFGASRSNYTSDGAPEGGYLWN